MSSVALLVKLTEISYSHHHFHIIAHSRLTMFNLASQFDEFRSNYSKSNQSKSSHLELVDQLFPHLWKYFQVYNYLIIFLKHCVADIMHLPLHCLLPLYERSCSNNSSLCDILNLAMVILLEEDWNVESFRFSSRFSINYSWE